MGANNLDAAYPEIRGELLKINNELAEIKKILDDFQKVNLINGNKKPWIRQRKDFEQDLYDDIKKLKTEQKKRDEEVEKALKKKQSIFETTGWLKNLIHLFYLLLGIYLAFIK